MPDLKYQKCIDACLKCASACNYCASSCLKEDEVKMMEHCVQLDMECAAFCYATAQLLNLGSSQAMLISILCADICDACAAECAKHKNDHCRKCAAACRECAAECKALKAT